jgi:aminoglycoside 2'-N-acetyltransferase I
MVSHALWGTRWLQVGTGHLLRTAYVEAVATHPDYRGRGLASEVMRRLASEIPKSFEVAALSPASMGFYERLGWRLWLGALVIRMPGGELLPTPDEIVMVLELEGRRPLDRSQRLSVEWRPGELW